MLNANELIAIIRFALLILSIGFFIKIFFKLHFKGFLTLACGLTFSASTFVLVETHSITATGPRYELLLLFVAVMFFLSAAMIYRSVHDYLNSVKKKA